MSVSYTHLRAHETEADRSISLTQEGHDVAQTVMRKHRLAECLLTQIIGLRPDLVHDEACRWEHVISGEVEKRLTGLLDNPGVSPYGCPLPPEQAGCCLLYTSPSPRDRG